MPTEIRTVEHIRDDSPREPDDFRAYIAQIKDAGATEQAQSEIQSVAVIMAGNAVLDFPKNPDTGEYGNSYRSLPCLKPGLSTQERLKLREESERRMKPIQKRLRQIADTDHSGFVSSNEARELRRTFEFGVKLAFLVGKEGKNKARLCKLLYVSPLEFDTRLKAYASFVKAFSGTPVSFLPAVPVLTV